MNTAFTNPGMPEHFGIRITSVATDKLVGELDADHRHVNGGGHVHGGTLAAFGEGDSPLRGDVIQASKLWELEDGALRSK